MSKREKNFRFFLRSWGEEELGRALDFLLNSPGTLNGPVRAEYWTEVGKESNYWLVVFPDQRPASEDNNWYMFPCSLSSRSLCLVVQEWLEDQYYPDPPEGSCSKGFEIEVPPSCTQDPAALFSVRPCWIVNEKEEKPCY